MRTRGSASAFFVRPPAVSPTRCKKPVFDRITIESRRRRAHASRKKYDATKIISGWSPRRSAGASVATGIENAVWIDDHRAVWPHRQTPLLMPCDLRRHADDAARAGDDATARETLERCWNRQKGNRSCQFKLFHRVMHGEVGAKKEAG